MTTALIFLPLAGALIVGLLPLRRRATEWLALVVALAEAVLGAIALIGFDTGGASSTSRTRAGSPTSARACRSATTSA